MTEHTTQLEQAFAADWKQWEGRVVNGEFPLHRYLGGSSHSAVFLTECVSGGAPSAAIKLIAEEPGKAEQQLKNWELASGLSHPNLIAVLQYGRCQLDGVQLLYVVMECADEDLSQILPHRAVTPLEAREMLRPALDALGYLHGMGLVHGHIKPANIMARADQVKLSADGIRRAGEPMDNSVDNSDIYSAPDKKYSGASDIWALGATLVEVLTQRLLVWERSGEPEPVVPVTLAEPFHQIARRCLRRNPALRFKAPDIASRLDPIPAQEIPPIATTVSTGWKFHYLVWTLALGLLFAAITASSIRLKSHHHARQALPSKIEQPKPQIAKEQTVAEIPPTTLRSSPTNSQSAPTTELRAPIQPIEKKLPVAETEMVQNPVLQNQVAQNGDDQNEGIHQVLPEAPQKARDTIRGTVRVSVKISVDPSGHVADAALDSPGPSRYFANLALKAAQQWTFGAANGSTTNTVREWILNFAFSPIDTRVRSVRKAP